MGRRRDRSLQRRKAFLQPRRRFTIFSEGKSTEPAYFEALRARLREAIIDIHTFGKGVTPKRVAEAAVAFLEANAPRDSFEEGDQVWAVFDRDTHGDFEDAVQLCDGSGVRVGRSNPCFEVWLILHIEDYHRPDKSSAVQAYLRKLRPEYDPRRNKCPDCAALVIEVGTAEQRAETQLAKRRQEGKPFGNPSTTVFELTREIHAAANASSRRG